MSQATVRYIVNDVESAIDFYTGNLGFLVLTHPAPGFAALECGSLHLLLNRPGAGGAGQPMPDGRLPEPGGWNRIQISVDDLDSVYAELKEKELKFRNEITEGKGGKQVILEDPSGNPVELFEPNEKGEAYKPEGYSSVTPYLVMHEAEKLTQFLDSVFDAEEHRLWRRDDGSLMHSEFRIGDSLVMIGGALDEHNPFPAMLYVYVPDVDSTYRKALNNGAVSIEEPSDQDYGDRRAAFSDPYGNTWYIASNRGKKP